MNPEVKGPVSATTQTVESRQIGTILAGYERARSALVTASRRNHLLHFEPVSSQQIIGIIDERPLNLFRLLVEETEQLFFSEKKEDTHNLKDSLDQPQSFQEVLRQSKSQHHSDHFLQTALTSTELQSRLLKLARESQTLESEKGINVLYLSLGSVRWTHPDFGICNSPLLLVPVKLKRSDALHNYHLEYTGEECQANLVLAHLLNSSGGEFPELSDSIRTFYTKAAKALSEKFTDIEVRPSDITLGLFSFGEQHMYSDLHVDNWPEDKKPWNNPIISSIFGGGFTDWGISRTARLTGNYQVLPIDSSQQAVIDEAGSKRCMVVEGPPGTGKSTTIVNIIAHALAHGKTVLFISEKTAALEVVRNWMARVGLEDTCLELHSGETSRQKVVADLVRTRELAQPEQSNRDKVLEQLQSAEAKLEGHVSNLQTEIAGSGFNLYQALSLYFEARDVKNRKILLTRTDFSRWDNHQYILAQNAVKALEEVLLMTGAPDRHIFHGTKAKQLNQRFQEEVLTYSEEAHKKAGKLTENADSICEILKLSLKSETELRKLAEIASLIIDSKSIYPMLGSTCLHDASWLTHQEEIRNFIDNGKEFAALQQKINKSFLSASHDLSNLQKLDRSLELVPKKWVHRNFPFTQYRRLSAELRDLFTAEAFNADFDTARQHLKDLISYLMLKSKIESADLPVKIPVSEKNRGDPDFWSKLEALNQVVLNFQTLFGSHPHKSEISEAITDFNRLEIAVPHIQSWKSLYSEYQELREKALSILEYELIREKFLEATFTDQSNLWLRWSQSKLSLQNIVRLQQIIEDLQSCGLGELVQKITENYHPDLDLQTSLKESWSFHLINHAMEVLPAVAGFNGERQILLQSQLAELLTALQRENAQSIALTHWEGLPKLVVGETGKMLGIELVKKARHKPIRQILASNAELIRRIKPVFMMSPGTVAQHLPAAASDFDYVIIDEGSQLKLAQGLGAFLRGEHLIMMGDPHQLPPTTFFERSLEMAAESDPDDKSSLESSLDLLLTAQAPRRSLRGHYRSLHPSLILPSQEHFYNGRLDIFPSNHIGTTERGLQFIHVPDGRWDRGGKRTNEIEADRVVDAIFEQISNQPAKSLGIVTLNSAQADAITRKLEERRRKDPSHEDFFMDESTERFFVKSLENVQGDERDVIMVSLGYGFDLDGRFPMNFGPINSNGGERRLNVLATRAKERCQIFASFLPEDLEVKSNSAAGLKFLKSYLESARNYQHMIPQFQPKREDLFVEFIAKQLSRKGYQVIKHVGTKTAAIDIAVVDPENPRQFKLGIMTDGLQYQSRGSVMERDLMHQRILEQMGWKICRSWSLDWLDNPERELQKIISILESEPDQAQVSARFKRSNYRVTRKSKNTYKAAGYREYLKASPDLEFLKQALEEQKSAMWGNDYGMLPVNLIKAAVGTILKEHGITHLEELYGIIKTSLYLNEISDSFRASLRLAISEHVMSGEIERVENDFIYPKNYEAFLARDRSGLSAQEKNFNYIPPEEIRTALILCARHSAGIPREDIYREAARLLGYKTVSQIAEQRISAELQNLIDSNRIVINNYFICENRLRKS